MPDVTSAWVSVPMQIVAKGQAGDMFGGLFKGLIAFTLLVIILAAVGRVFRPAHKERQAASVQAGSRSLISFAPTANVGLFAGDTNKSLIGATLPLNIKRREKGEKGEKPKQEDSSGEKPSE